MTNGLCGIVEGRPLVCDTHANFKSAHLGASVTEVRQLDHGGGGLGLSVLAVPEARPHSRLSCALRSVVVGILGQAPSRGHATRCVVGSHLLADPRLEFHRGVDRLVFALPICLDPMAMLGMCGQRSASGLLRYASAVHWSTSPRAWE